MYHFIKLENGTWYLRPHTEQDILDHFNKVMRREFTEGLEDRKEGTFVIKSFRDPNKPEKNIHAFRYAIYLDNESIDSRPEYTHPDEALTEGVKLCIKIIAKKHAQSTQER